MADQIEMLVLGKWGLGGGGREKRNVGYLQRGVSGPNATLLSQARETARVIKCWQSKSRLTNKDAGDDAGRCDSRSMQR